MKPGKPWKKWMNNIKKMWKRALQKAWDLDRKKWNKLLQVFRSMHMTP